jgi:hypothetical protein
MFRYVKILLALQVSRDAINASLSSSSYEIYGGSRGTFEVFKEGINLHKRRTLI